MNPATDKLLKLVKELTDYRVVVGTTGTDTGDAEMISAGPEHPVHMINVSRGSLAFADYIIAMQCTMLITMWSHPLGIPTFQPKQDKVRSAIKKTAGWKKLAQLPPAKGEQIAQTMVVGLLHQLRSTPFELVGIDYCYRECQSLRELQAGAVNSNLRRNTESMRPEIKEIVPPDIFRKNQVLGAALARYWCDLTNTETPMIPYKTIGVDTDAGILVEKFRACEGSQGERCVTAVDAWAEELGLRNMYEWTYRAK